MNNERLSKFAYQLLKSHVADDPYKEILLFAEVLAALDESDGTQRREYENQAATMEQTASACLQAKEQLLEEYNKILEQQEHHNHNWIAWDRGEMQA